MSETGQTTENLFFEDQFARADSSTVGDPWQVTGLLEIENGALHQIQGAGAVDNALAFIAQADLPAGITREVYMGVFVACEDDTTARYFYLVPRSCDATLIDGYMVFLKFENNVATLGIVKRTGSSDTTLDSVVVTDEMVTASSSYDNVFQRLSCRLLEGDGGITIEACLNDEERPRLTATDVTHPLHSVLAYVGMRAGDMAVGVGGHLFAKNFFIQGLADQQGDFDYQERGNWTVGELISRARAIALRDSSDLTGGDDWLTYANMAYQEYYDALGRPDAFEQDITFVCKTGQTDVELPPWVDNYDDQIRVGNNVWPVINERNFREDYAALDETTTGTPYLFRKGGRGSQRGLVLRPYPVPNADTTCKVRIFRRPGWVSDKSTPLALPDGESYRLIAGMIHLYALSDTSRDKMRAWSMKWEQYIKQARRANTRRDSVGTRRYLRPGTIRGRTTGIDGRTRGGQGRSL